MQVCKCSPSISIVLYKDLKGPLTLVFRTEVAKPKSVEQVWEDVGRPSCLDYDVYLWQTTGKN